MAATLVEKLTAEGGGESVGMFSDLRLQVLISAVLLASVPGLG